MNICDTSIKRYIIISDLHLTQTIDNDARIYRSPQLIEELDIRLVKFLERYVDSESCVIFLGDSFDFDLVIEVELNPLEKLKLIFEHHKILLKELKNILPKAKKVCFIAGNHDLELFIDQIRQKLRELLSINEEQYLFCPLFLFIPGVAYMEHGNRFDSYNSLPNPLNPFIESTGELFLPLGSMASRFIANYLYSVEPFFEGEASKRLSQYLLQYITRDFKPPWRLPLKWGKGALTSFLTSKKYREKINYCEDTIYTSTKEYYKRYTNFTEEEIERIIKAGRPPIYLKSLFLVARAVWLDRTALLLGTMPILTPPISLILYLIYERILGNDISRELIIQRKVRKELASNLRVPLFITGHTHKIEISKVSERNYYINGGFWGPKGRKVGRKVIPAEDTATATIIEKGKEHLNIVLIKMGHNPDIILTKKIIR